MFFPVHFVKVAVMQEIFKIKETGSQNHKIDPGPLGIRSTNSYN